MTIDEAIFILGAALVVAESATSIMGMVILQNSNVLKVIRLHQVSWHPL